MVAIFFDFLSNADRLLILIMAPVQFKCGHMCDATFSSTENELIFLLIYSH